VTADYSGRMPSTPVDMSVPPSGAGCVECLPDPAGWWFHLRRCAECGHIGCCDSSPSQHSSRHAAASGHPIIQSFEPGETWFWDFRTQTMVDGPELAPPSSHPAEQSTPGPADRVPADWQSRLH
jgi:Zn-finger in ubiquitin-hydrolases and other protein